MKKLTKKQRESLRALVSKHMDEISVAVNEHGDWLLDTKYGRATASLPMEIVDFDMPNPDFTLFHRFKEPERARGQVSDMNPNSGKRNFHFTYTKGTPFDVFMAQVMRHIRAYFQKIILKPKVLYQVNTDEEILGLLSVDPNTFPESFDFDQACDDWINECYTEISLEDLASFLFGRYGIKSERVFAEPLNLIEREKSA